MCFSDSNVNSRESKDNFKQMVEERNKRARGKQFSQFVISMVEYMQKILESKVGIRVTEEKSMIHCLPCYSYDSTYSNVRREFQKSYESCSSKEQLDYYIKFVNLLLGSKSIAIPFRQPKLSMANEEPINRLAEEQSFFDVEVKGKITWTSGYKMKLIPEKSAILLKSISQKETLLNLRNYIFRQSSLSRENAYVLIGIVPIEPYKLKFSPSRDVPNRMEIISRIRQLADKALEQNVNSWRQPISQISSLRSSQTGNKKNVVNFFDKSKVNQKDSDQKKEEVQDINQNKIKEINNPLKNMFYDKAKAGMIKKTLEYKDDLEGKDKAPTKMLPSSTKRISEKFKQSSSNEMKDEGEFDEDLQFFKQNNKNDAIAAMKEKPFSKKSKPTSYLSARQPELIISPLPSVRRMGENYAQQPDDTRSDSHVQQYEKDKLKRANIISDKLDSGKSLVNDIEQMILEEEEFGNLSEISHDTHTTFQTIPEPQ